MRHQLALLGANIQHSKMPALQRYLALMTGCSLTYELMDSSHLDTFDLHAWVLAARMHGFTGLNITHPFKQEIVPLVSSPLREQYQCLGSYNTLVLGDDIILGANTDYTGFIQAYRMVFPDSSPGRTFVMGAGGVGRAISFALANLGAVEICISDLDPLKASSLVSALNKQGYKAFHLSVDSWVESAPKADGILNCTPLGSYSHPGSAIPARVIGKQQWAFDAVYTPMRTEFSIACENTSVPVMNGFMLWLHQGVDAFAVFTGVELGVTPEIIRVAQEIVRQPTTL
jgi:shikimate dehydrogenase